MSKRKWIKFHVDAETKAELKKHIIDLDMNIQQYMNELITEQLNKKQKDN